MGQVDGYHDSCVLFFISTHLYLYHVIIGKMEIVVAPPIPVLCRYAGDKGRQSKCPSHE